MTKRAKAFLGVLALVVQLAVVVAVAPAASAATGPGDDRQLTAKTSWWTYTGVTASQVSTFLSNNHARLTDLTVDDASVPTFNVVMVGNSGAYQTGWWWYYGQTTSSLSTLLTNNKARLIALQGYPTAGGVRYAAVMVDNTGANARGWTWWVNASVTTLSSKLSTYNERLVNLNPYPGSSTTYTAVMVDNTGTNATGWWWYVHASTATISSHLSTNHARNVDLSRNDDGTWNVIMYANPSTRWYWYVNTSLTAAVSRAVQQGERLIDVSSYSISGTKYWAVVSTIDLNATEAKLWNIIGPVVDSGKYGFYLKQVGGATIAGLESSSPYEPASALKVLYHAYSIHEESLGAAHDTDTITYHYDPAAPTNAGICPDNYATTSTTNLKNADQQMMWNSDNRMTKGIFDKYGKTAILNYGASLGLTSTAVNHDIGCPTPTTHNRTTLVDLGRVYTAYQTNTITSDATWKAQFVSRMLNQSNYSGFKNQICPVVQQEATKLGKSSTTATSFCNAMTWIAKGGSYQYGGSLPYQVSWDGLSLTGVPYRSGGTAAPRYYVFGEYIDGTTINSQTEANTINTARGNEYVEALRPYINAALQTWP